MKQARTLTWKKSGKVVRKDETVIVYSAGPWRIESVKRGIPHANGRGTWDFTDYHLYDNDGIEVKAFNRLADAKEYAQRLEDEWNAVSQT